MFADQTPKYHYSNGIPSVFANRKIKISQKDFLQTYLLSQNWIAYESLQNAAKLNSNQQIVDFPNDESPKEDYHNAFCQVRSFTPREPLTWKWQPFLNSARKLYKILNPFLWRGMNKESGPQNRKERD